MDIFYPQNFSRVAPQTLCGEEEKIQCTVLMLHVAQCGSEGAKTNKMLVVSTLAGFRQLTRAPNIPAARWGQGSGGSGGSGVSGGVRGVRSGGWFAQGNRAFCCFKTSLAADCGLPF